MFPILFVFAIEAVHHRGQLDTPIPLPPRFLTNYEKLSIMFNSNTRIAYDSLDSKIYRGHCLSAAWVFQSCILKMNLLFSHRVEENSEQSRVRHNQEIRALEKLVNVKAVAQIYGVVVLPYNESFYDEFLPRAIIMEDVGNDSLLDELNKSCKDSEAKRRELLDCYSDKILKAVIDMKNHGVVHVDLHMRNIYLPSSISKCKDIKIIDFSNVRLLLEESHPIPYQWLNLIIFRLAIMDDYLSSSCHRHDGKKGFGPSHTVLKHIKSLSGERYAVLKIDGRRFVKAKAGDLLYAHSRELWLGKTMFEKLQKIK